MRARARVGVLNIKDKTRVNEHDKILGIARKVCGLTATVHWLYIVPGRRIAGRKGTIQSIGGLRIGRED